MQDFRVKTFLTVCRTLNYTRAAEELALTQPAVSQHITYPVSYTHLLVAQRLRRSRALKRVLAGQQRRSLPHPNGTEAQAQQAGARPNGLGAVSYTPLDVYKRQAMARR